MVQIIETNFKDIFESKTSILNSAQCNYLNQDISKCSKIITEYKCYIKYKHLLQ